jgi:hypothetical protein
VTVVDHGLHYAIPAAFVSRAAGAPTWGIVAIASVFGILNAIPDLAGPVVGFLVPSDVHVSVETIELFGLKIRYRQRWDIYFQFHWGKIAQRWGWLWAAHVWVDAKMHEQTGESWWPKMWPLASAYWLAEIAAIAIYFQT